MSTAWGNTARKGRKKVSRAYNIKVHEGSGTLYLERERSPLFLELPYVFALVFAVTFALLSCLQYIQLKTNVEYAIRNTQTLESQLFSLQNNNVLVEKDLSYIQNLNYIYEVATTSLEMVPISEANILFYERTNKEYVYQRDSIPSIGLP